MEKEAQKFVDEFMAGIVAKNAGEPEFHQAVKEVAESLAEYIVMNPVLSKMKVLERIAEPERVIIFRVPWLNDKGEIEINRGYRVQMNSAIGPYKGGIRFHPSVNLSILKFLASSRPSRTASRHCRWAAARAVRTSTPKANPTTR